MQFGASTGSQVGRLDGSFAAQSPSTALFISRGGGFFHVYRGSSLFSSSLGVVQKLGIAYRHLRSRCVSGRDMLVPRHAGCYGFV